MKKELESERRMSRAKDIQIDDMQEKIKSLEDNLSKNAQQLSFPEQVQELTEDIKKQLESQISMCRRKDLEIHQLKFMLNEKEEHQKKVANKEEEINSLDQSPTKEQEQLSLKQAQELCGEATMVTEPNKRTSFLPSIDGMLCSNRWYSLVPLLFLISFINLISCVGAWPICNSMKVQ